MEVRIVAEFGALPRAGVSVSLTNSSAPGSPSTGTTDSNGTLKFIFQNVDVLGTQFTVAVTSAGTFLGRPLIVLLLQPATINIPADQGQVDEIYQVSIQVGQIDVVINGDLVAVGADGTVAVVDGQSVPVLTADELPAVILGAAPTQIFTLAGVVYYQQSTATPPKVIATVPALDLPTKQTPQPAPPSNHPTTPSEVPDLGSEAGAATGGEYVVLPAPNMPGE